MEYLFWLIAVVAAFIAGYAVRGFVHGKLVELGEYVKDVHSRLTAASAKEESALRAEVNKILDELKKYIG